MTRNWEPGVQYNLGDNVEYQGKRYNIIQSHRSQSDWTPDVTPALWGVVPHYTSGDGHTERYPQDAHNNYNQPPANNWSPPPPTHQPEYGQSQQQGGYGQGQYQGGYGQDQQQGGYVQPPQGQLGHSQTQQQMGYGQPQQSHPGYGQAQQGQGGYGQPQQGPVGGGFTAYQHHEREDRKAPIGSMQHWLQEAQERTRIYHSSGPTAPVSWILVHGKEIPQNAIVGGKEGENTLYVARAYHEGGVQVGKASKYFRKGGIVGFKRDEIDYDTYEVLIGDERAVRWVEVRGKLDLNNLHGCRPIEGGHEANGDPLYIAQGTYKGNTICGKATTKRDAALLPANGSEHDIDEYRVLCYVVS